MNSRNLNYYYYVEYYNGVNFLNPEGCQDKLLDHNRELCNYAAQKSDLMVPLGKNLAPQSIELQTVYPGMLIGTGLAHGFGGKGEAALGLCLDYVTGMPYIPGSSVKGALRSAFDDHHEGYVQGILKELGVENADKDFIKKLEVGIFGKRIKDDKCESNPMEEDIFFDAIVTSTGKLFATDAITPHRADPELLELANPIPLTLIRIRPGVTFKFQFSLKPETLGISAEIKLKLFKQILLDLGIGAKTNVGYGQLAEPSNGAEPSSGANAGANTGRTDNGNNRNNNSGNNNHGMVYSSQTQQPQNLMFKKSMVCPKCHKKAFVRYAALDSKFGICDKCKKQVPIN